MGQTVTYLFVLHPLGGTSESLVVADSAGDTQLAVVGAGGSGELDGAEGAVEIARMSEAAAVAVLAGAAAQEEDG